MDLLLTTAARRIGGPVLRFSVAIMLAWIGALKFAGPSPVVGLLHASPPFLGLMAAAVNVIALAPVRQPRPALRPSIPVEVH